MVRKWVQQFNGGNINVYGEAWSGWPSVLNDGVVAKMPVKILENRWFTVRMLRGEFLQISKTV